MSTPLERGPLDFSPSDEHLSSMHIYNPSKVDDAMDRLDRLDKIRTRVNIASTLGSFAMLGLFLIIGAPIISYIGEYLTSLNVPTNIWWIGVGVVTLILMVVTMRLSDVITYVCRRWSHSLDEKQAEVWTDTSWVLPGEYLSGFHVHPDVSKETIWNAVSLIHTSAPIQHKLQLQCHVSNPSPNQEEDHRALHEEMDALYTKVGQMLNPEWVPESK